MKTTSEKSLFNSLFSIRYPYGTSSTISCLPLLYYRDGANLQSFVFWIHFCVTSDLGMQIKQHSVIKRGKTNCHLWITKITTKKPSEMQLISRIPVLIFDSVNSSYSTHWKEEGSPFLCQNAMQDHSTQDTQLTEWFHCGF